MGKATNEKRGNDRWEREKEYSTFYSNIRIVSFLKRKKERKEEEGKKVFSVDYWLFGKKNTTIS